MREYIVEFHQNLFVTFAVIYTVADNQADWQTNT